MRNSSWPSGEETRRSSWAAAVRAARVRRARIRPPRGMPARLPAWRAEARSTLCPTEARFGERQRADALAGGGEDRVSDGREHRRKRRLAETGRVVLGLQEVALDVGRGLRQPQHLMLVVVGLLDAALVDG